MAINSIEEWLRISDIVLETTTVQSSNIASIGYNEVKGEMYIRFRDGSLYVYYDVPKIVYQQVKQGRLPAAVSDYNPHSVGGTFWKMVRRAGYPYKKLQ